MLRFFGTDSSTELDEARGPSDRVVPLHFFDDGPLWKAFILYSMFVFDEVLDPEKLRSCLERLTRKDGWWKLGARLRQNVCFLMLQIPYKLEWAKTDNCGCRRMEHWYTTYLQRSAQSDLHSHTLTSSTTSLQRNTP